MANFPAYMMTLALMIASCNGQFGKNICVGEIEIAFSTTEKKFDSARADCSTFGGDLVKIGSTEIQTAIENAVVVRPEYYIGAFDVDDNNAYHWLADNTAVPKNPLLSWAGPSGYQNWKGNQPNNDAERCVALGVHNVHAWSDVMCSGMYRYICQRGSEQMLTIAKSNDTVTCVSGLDITVRWEKNSVVVKSSGTSGVYQTTGSNSATLHLKNAKITEAGTYVCVSSTPSCIAQTRYEVTVDGTPSIIKIQNNKCNSNLIVTWKPNRGAVGFNHRIVASNSTSVTIFDTASSDELHETEIAGLKHSTRYSIEITACEATGSCAIKFTAWSEGKTDGMADPTNNELCPNLPKEPEYVQPPATFKTSNGNSVIIEIRKPNDSTGLISCVFVITCHVMCSTNEFNFEKLKMANGTDWATLESERYSIAAALPMSKFANGRYLFKLSSGSITHCDVYDNGVSRSDSFNGVFRGQNVAEKVAAIFTATATLSNGKVLLKTSSAMEIAETAMLQDNLLWIIGIAAGSVTGILIGIVIGVLAARCSNKKSQIGKDNQLEPGTL